MRNVLVDAGPLVAAIDAGDPMHSWAVDEMRKLRGRYVTVWPAVTEACHLLAQRDDRGPAVLLDSLSENEVSIASLGRDDFPALNYLIKQYHDLPMQLADAAIVHAYQRDAFDAVMTLDRRDFTVYRVAGKPIRVIMPDLRS